jgi:hypothetical protein
MRRLALLLAVACLSCALPFGSLMSQEPAPQSDALYVFLDCQTFHCDFDHFRREISYVNWMRDRQDAQVHVLGTSQATGGGGREHTLTFIGLGDFQGRVDTLVYVSSNTDTDTERRDALVQTVKLGLVPFLAATPLAQGLRITYEAPGAGPPTVTAADDPWNLWVFETSVNAQLNGESEYRSLYGYGWIRADRVAEDLKLNLRVSGTYSRQETDVPELDTT